MTKTIFSWLGKEFVELSSEAKSGAIATAQGKKFFTASTKNYGPWGSL